MSISGKFLQHSWVGKLVPGPLAEVIDGGLKLQDQDRSVAPTTLDSSWQLKWKRLGRGICLFVLFLFLFIQKQFQQVHCVYS